MVTAYSGNLKISMGTKYNLSIMPRAATDLDSIFTYISNELSSPKASQNLMSKIEKSFMRLRDMPESCPLCQDEILFAKGYRKLVVNSYIALYTVNQETRAVIVMRVFYGRQYNASYL